MFPNPQAALPLPPRPHLEQYRKLAKELVKACQSGHTDAIRDWVRKWVETLVKLAGLTITPRLPVRVEHWIGQVEEFARRKLSSSEAGAAKCALADAQFVIARSHGFESWPKFAKNLEQLANGNSSVSQFEAAAEAIITGDAATLRRLLRENPELIRARAMREHRATLLHYTSANGVEGYRQKTPKNAVEIAEILLKAGAEVDAEADVYGGGATTLGLVATSVHPQHADVQIALMEKLLEYGAALDARGAGNQHDLVKGCLANGQPQAARFLASRGAPLDLQTAAGLGRLDLVKSYFTADGSLQPNATMEQLHAGFLWACGYGSNNVVEFLLARGIDIGMQSNDGQTGLHWAVIGGHPDTVKLLLERGAPLETQNAYGGTVLGQAFWSFINGDPETDYVPIFEILLAAGARIEDGSLAWLQKQQGRPAAAKARIAEVLRRYGART